MEGFSCDAIKSVVYMLLCEDELKWKIFVAGGIVPWILSDNQSGRTHSDIDIVVKAENMKSIRRYLEKHNYYHKEMDSMTFHFNKSKMDYGVEAIIDGIPVNFAPFEVSGSNIIQRNFFTKALMGTDALVTAIIENISINDYVSNYVRENQIVIGAYTLEVVKATKEKTNREKDMIDLLEIEKLVIENDRYARVQPSIQNMRVELQLMNNVNNHQSWQN